ncbi:hypothetical protein BaRGS_00028134 [Batillaria attramentaria]|uniref:Uncharacterized protein n=1 Tax=Batillaria attramentaria TaxID=370345 RepID=A0ABD0K1D0_9CAEN
MWTQKALLPAACLIVLASQALAQYNPGPSYNSHPGGYGPKFDPKELQKLANAAHRAANEKIFLKERLDMLKMQKQELFDKLDKIEDEILAAFEATDATQDHTLIDIKDKIKLLLHQLGDLEARVAGAAAVAVRNEACLPSLAGRIESLVQSNIDQNAQLSKIDTFLDEAKEKLNEKLGFTVEGANDDIATVKDATKAFTNLLNTRKCDVGFENVPISYEDGEGEVYVNFGADFGGNVPAVYCGVQGFVSKLNLDKSQGYGYGYPDPRQTVAFSTDCKAFEDRVLIKAFDYSRGKGNSVDSVIVEYKACSFAAVSGFTH